VVITRVTPSMLPHTIITAPPPALALGLGIVLLGLVALVNAGAYLVGEASRRKLG